MSGENTVSSDEKALGAGPWQRKYPVELDLYEITNLRALLGAVGGLAGHSPLETAHTGDWTLQIAWKLDAIQMEVPEHFGPNATAEQMVERANADCRRVAAERDRAQRAPIAAYRLASVGPDPVVSETDGRIVVEWPYGRGWSCEVSSDLIEEWAERMNDLTAERDRARSVAVALEQELARKDQALDEIRALHWKADGIGICELCGSWPCDTQRVLAALDAQLNKEDDETMSYVKIVCQCASCAGTTIHASDCAVHNEPAFPAGPCDCRPQRLGGGA